MYGIAKVLRPVSLFERNNKADMNQIMKKVWKILLIILVIAAGTVLLNIMWYLLYYRNHYSRYKFEWRGEGKLLLEGGGEYEESIPLRLDGVYFDHEIFYPDKDSLWLQADCNGNVFFDGFYYIGNMEGFAPDLLEPEDRVILEEYNGRLAYADFQSKEQWAYIFYMTDISQIINNGESGQKGLLVVTSQDSSDPEEVVQKAIRKSEIIERVRTEPIWEAYIRK